MNGRLGHGLLAPAGWALDSLRTAGGYLNAAPHVLRGLAAAGVIAPVRPDRVLGMLAGLNRTGLTVAAAAAFGAARYPDRAAVLDERGRLTFAQLEAQTARIAAGLGSGYQLARGRRVGILCRNHRGFVTALVAASRVGADLVLINTEFAAPQLASVLRRERIDALIADQEFLPAIKATDHSGPCIVAWTDEPAEGLDTLENLAWRGGKPARRAYQQGQLVIMTSGTTGTPRGAARQPPALGLLPPVGSMLTRVPLRSGEPMLICPPLFHALGLAFMLVALFIGCPIVLHRRFDPVQALAAIERHRAGSMIVVPVMLQRIMELPGKERGCYDTTSLRAVVSSGSALRPDLASAFMDAFGDVVHNLYGSSEAAWGSLATPDELRAAPGTVGRPPHGTTLKILDEDGAELPAGQVGRIFVGSALSVEGYTGDEGGDGKGSDDGERGGTVRGLVPTGDLGHFDSSGLLFVDGRADDMIVSGGENVFPQEVEETLLGHHAVADAAVIGVPDERFGQRLSAAVVLRPGAQASADELREHVRANLARYKVPRDVHFVDELPRNSTGKVLRKQLAERIAG